MSKGSEIKTLNKSLKSQANEVLFITTKMWKQLKYLLMDGERNEIYLYDGLLLIQRKEEILPFITTQGNLDDLGITEINQTKTNSA